LNYARPRAKLHLHHNAGASHVNPSPPRVVSEFHDVAPASRGWPRSSRPRVPKLGHHPAAHLRHFSRFSLIGRSLSNRPPSPIGKNWMLAEPAQPGRTIYERARNVHESCCIRRRFGVKKRHANLQVAPRHFRGCLRYEHLRGSGGRYSGPSRRARRLAGKNERNEPATDPACTTRPAHTTGANNSTAAHYHDAFGSHAGTDACRHAAAVRLRSPARQFREHLRGSGGRHSGPSRRARRLAGKNERTKPTAGAAHPTRTTGATGPTKPTAAHHGDTFRRDAGATGHDHTRHH